MSDSWLQELKVGDLVFISGIYSSTALPAKVSRMTEASIFVVQGKGDGKSSEMRFRRKDGEAHSGSTWHRRCLMEPTKELADEFSMLRLRQRARHLKEQLAIPEDREPLLAFIKSLESISKEHS